MIDNRKNPIEIAKEIFSKLGKEDSIKFVENAIDEKRKEKPSALRMMFFVEEINYLKDVIKHLEEIAE